MIATFVPAAPRVAAFGRWLLTRSRPRLGLRFVVTFPRRQSNALSSFEAPLFVSPLSGGTTHCATTGAGAGAVTVTVAEALSFAALASLVAEATDPLTLWAPACVPRFASFPLLGEDRGRAALRRYFEPFLATAHELGVPYVLDTATWRANPDWAAQLGYDKPALAAVNTDAVAFARELAEGRPDITINGALGPRGDGYVVGEQMTSDEAAEYHAWQIGVLREAGAEQITAITLTYPEEAIGVVDAAGAAGLPVVVGFTVETDGRLPTGASIAEAIEEVDSATGGAAEFFVVNCAHPTHIAAGLDGAAALGRVGGLRVNASALSHAELDEAEELDEGDPVILARDNAALKDGLPSIRLLGGCCGTDHRHVAEMIAAWNAA